MVDKHKKSDTGIAQKLIAELMNTTYRPFSMVFFYVFLKLSEKISAFGQFLLNTKKGASRPIFEL